MALKDMRLWQYTDDFGNVWGLRVAKYISDQQGVSLAVKIGGAAAATSLTPVPKGLRPRRATFVAADGYKRTHAIMNVASELWTDVETTLSFKDGDGVSHVCTLSRKTAELDKRIYTAPGV